MKKNSKSIFMKILIGILLLAGSIVITIIGLIQKQNITSYIIITLQFFGILGIIYIMFPYNVSKFLNSIHSLFNRESSDDEPSTFSIYLTRVIGIILLIIQLSILL